MGRRVELVLVTPAMAELWLGRINIQRKLSANTVETYVNDMLAGRWTADSNAICFNSSGELVNGQHRLRAVVRSGVSIEFLVMYDVGTADILNMDVGRPRSAADQLHIFGTPNASNVAAASRAIILYDNCPHVVWSGKSVALSKAQITEFARDNDTVLQEAVRVAYQLQKAIGMKTTVGAALAFLVDRDSTNDHLWDDFLEGVLTGAGLSLNDPRLALRNYCVRKPAPAGWGHAQQSNLFAALRAWNKFVFDQDMRLLKMPRREELPMPKVA